MVSITYSNDMAETLVREIDAFLEYVSEQMKQADRPRSQGPKHTQAYVGLRALKAKLTEHLKQLEANEQRIQCDARPPVRQSRRFR